MPDQSEWIVSREESGTKLVSFLGKYLNHRYSARQLKKLIEDNGCQVNGRVERFASFLLGTGDQVVLNFKQTSSSISNTFERSRVLYEDADLFIYNKPAAVTCDNQGIIALLRPFIPEIQLVHRLDRHTTGVLVLAKNKFTFEALVDQFKQFQVFKSYRAIVDGRMNTSKGYVENFLGKKHLYQGQTIWGEVSISEGLYARTDWICLKVGKNASLLKCIPKTGRTHQIRVHLAGIGHPILGDYQYGKKFISSYKTSRYLLHAEEINFIHPRSKQPIKIQAESPIDFLKAEHELF
jgi:23S rRNA pseudouridine955/2504/2580 synthase/23S rRNA pseudouridine1911/1915/1917 synthase